LRFSVIGTASVRLTMKCFAPFEPDVPLFLPLLTPSLLMELVENATMMSVTAVKTPKITKTGSIVLCNTVQLDMLILVLCEFGLFYNQDRFALWAKKL